MKKTGLIWGLVLVGVGLVGLLATSALLGGRAATGSFSSLGQRIYSTGVDANGPIPRSIGEGGMMGSVACVDCHGPDGRGRHVGMMFGGLDVPDIRYSTLTSPRTEGGETVPAWTDSDIARAIRTGVEPSGESLDPPMPRWDMTDADVNAVIAYLKELSKR